MRAYACALFLAAALSLHAQSRVATPRLPEITADAKTPDQRSGGQFVLAANVRATNFAPGGENAEFVSTMNRSFVVSNLSDEGPGSLRDALLQAQQLCEAERCNIAFAIEGAPRDGRFVIRPLTMLPEIRGVVTVDGATQTRFGGDTNPDGPEIEINGSDIGGPVFGGLLLGTGCRLHVFDLTIADFPAPGLTVKSGPYDFQGCSEFNGGQEFEDEVGSPPGSVVIARNHLTRNYRGVAVVESGSTEIEDNLITNNQRSGVFTERIGFISIFRNRVTDNGASGIFLWITGTETYPSKVQENVVTGNAEWGIARVPIGDVFIRKNSIFGNRYPALDVGLDFDTPNRGSDGGEDGRGIPNKPVLASAQYDPVINKTILRGRLDSDEHHLVNQGLRIDVYASAALSASGHSQAERWLVSVMVPDGHTDLLIELEGDLRGRYITATNERRRLYGFDVYLPNTSELSNAVKVQ